jgi:hypothetical protein
MSLEATIESYLGAVRREGEAIAGPVFTRIFSESAAEYAAKSTGRTAPRISGLEDLKAFLMEVGQADPNVTNALGYATAKAEHRLAGGIGPISGRILRANVQDILQIAGLYDKASTMSPVDCVNSLFRFLTDVEVFKEGAYSIQEKDKENLTLTIDQCPFAETCKQIQEAGIKKIIGEECSLQNMASLAIELLLKRVVDYKVVAKNIGQRSGCSGNLTVL